MELYLIDISAYTGGGALYNDFESELYLYECTVDSNLSSIWGGAAENYGRLEFYQSTINHNHSVEGGGAVMNQEEGSLYFENSTISGNTSYNVGGAVWNEGFMDATFSTICLNNAPGFYYGGAIMNDSVCNFYNTLIYVKDPITNNNSVIGNSPTTSYGYNLITDTTAVHLIPGSGEILGNSSNPIDPKLDLNLGDNGGSTYTHKLLQNSPAIDAGQLYLSILIDQTGKTRNINRPDIGSFEVDQCFPSSYMITSAQDTGAGSIRDLVANACPGDTLMFSNSLSQDKIFLNSGKITINKHLTILNTTNRNFVLSGLDLYQVFLIDSVVEVTLAGFTIADGYILGGGGAILNRYGNLTLDRMNI